MKLYISPRRKWPTGLLISLKGLPVPTMLIHGRDDRVTHFEASLQLTATIPNSRLLLLNRCGHSAQLEYANEFNALVDSFLNYS